MILTFRKNAISHLPACSNNCSCKPLFPGNTESIILLAAYNHDLERYKEHPEAAPHEVSELQRVPLMSVPCTD